MVVEAEVVDVVVVLGRGGVKCIGDGTFGGGGGIGDGGVGGGGCCIGVGGGGG